MSSSQNNVVTLTLEVSPTEAQAIAVLRANPTYLGIIANLPAESEPEMVTPSEMLLLNIMRADVMNAMLIASSPRR